MTDVQKGTWVRIRRIVLDAAQRTGRIPDETKSVPFVTWSKGFLQQDANFDDEVTVITRTGRLETGVLEETHPQYELNYGNFVPELMYIGDESRKMLSGGERP